ncbi:response regulator transcription factor [Plantactinospora sp. CA-294935]|uniref:response regulator transcription factor n=1 Tax=Plantactinospora sp. CA-294935 TaxID=3240012 RepID=UPI003D8D8EE7
MIGVLFVDDEPMVRAGLAPIFLPSQSDLRVVGECGAGAEVRPAVVRHVPDVVCMAGRVPGTDGIEATRRGAAPPATRPSMCSPPSATRTTRRPWASSTRNGHRENHPEDRRRSRPR